jgi:hypothetical protein
MSVADIQPQIFPLLQLAKVLESCLFCSLDLLIFDVEENGKSFLTL